MIGYFLVLLSISSAFGGVSVQMPYLNPAGVTYSGFSPVVHAPLLPSALTTRTSVAYGNGFYGQGVVSTGLAATAPLAAAPLAAAPVVGAPYAAAPIAQVAHVAPVAHAAPLVPAVQHVPAYAHVPVTKYEAQPAVVQNVVDVAKPKLATRTYEVRRPAVEKQFFDVEERVVVRPAGSAVVELDQPVSKTQRGPTVVSPAFHGVAPVAAVRTQSVAAVGTLPLAHTVASLRAFPVAHAVHTSPVVHVPAHPAHVVRPVESFVVSSTPAPAFEVPQPQPQFPPQQDLPQTPQNFPEPQFDESDSVAVENPEFARARSQVPQQTQDDQFFRFAQQLRQAQFYARQQLQQPQVAPQVNDQPLQRSQAPLPQLPQQAQQPQNFQVSARTGLGQQQQQQQQQQQLNTGFFRSSLEPSLPRASARSDVFPSVRLSPEQNLNNQERLLSLLAGRGGVAETRGAEENDVGGPRVRTRVLSVTPAPYNAEPQDERVNTRRVVVNRPVTTVEQVEVVEPFTKLERVTVNQPALIKTARIGVASVPTSVPVQTYAHAVPHAYHF